MNIEQVASHKSIHFILSKTIRRKKKNLKIPRK